jgi:hypothetical protein
MTFSGRLGSIRSTTSFFLGRHHWNNSYFLLPPNDANEARTLRTPRCRIRSVRPGDVFFTLCFPAHMPCYHYHYCSHGTTCSCCRRRRQVRGRIFVIAEMENPHDIMHRFCTSPLTIRGCNTVTTRPFAATLENQFAYRYLLRKYRSIRFHTCAR